MFIVKFIIVILLLAVLASLAAGMFSLVKDGGKTNRTARFLTFRIALSIFTFVFIAVAFFMGWIEPHGILPPGN